MFYLTTHRGKTKDEKHEVELNYFMDWLSADTIREPATLVIVPKKKGKGGYMVDVKYMDFTGIEDVPYGYPEAECYIVPPYKPLMYTALYSPTEEVDVFAIRGTTNHNYTRTHTHGHMDTQINEMEHFLYTTLHYVTSHHNIRFCFFPPL